MDETQPPAQGNISGRRFGQSLHINQALTDEPRTYIGEEPYELLSHEFATLKMGKFKTSSWFEIFASATGGFVLAVLSKAAVAFYNRSPSLFEAWEIIAIVIGIAVTAFAKRYPKKGEDALKFEQTKKDIEEHFNSSSRKRFQINPKKGAKK